MTTRLNDLFKPKSLGGVEAPNGFVFPPVKLGYGNPDGNVTERQLLFYRQIAHQGPGIIILEPVSVTPEGREHPRQLCVHLPGSAAQLKKVADAIHDEGRLACLHLNHAGGAANPKVIGGKPKSPSAFTCPTHGQESVPLGDQELREIVFAYGAAAAKAVQAGFDLIEIQAGHGYLISQFLNGRINRREDSYGLDRLLFAREVFSAVRQSAPKLPIVLRISGNEMSPEMGIAAEDLSMLIKWANDEGIAAFHAGMGNACFSPPWYFHHGSLPLAPQVGALTWLRDQTSLPLIVAGRMGRKERIEEILEKGLADFVALGRPLIADPDLLEKWQKEEMPMSCGYCLQGCLHRLKTGEPLGCNINPEIGMAPLKRSEKPLTVLVAGGGPAGMSAALYLTRRGHKVTLAEKDSHLGGQFALAWKAPGKEPMHDSFRAIEQAVQRCGASILLSKVVDADLVRDVKPDLLVWATGGVQNEPQILGLNDQYVMTSLEFFREEKKIRGPRVLVIGAGRTGLEIAEKLGKEGYEVVATKRTDPMGSMMEMITRNLLLKRIHNMGKVSLLPHTTVRAFYPGRVDIEQDGSATSLEAFQTVVLASGMMSSPGPGEEIRREVPETAVVGDASDVRDIFSAVQAGYRLALEY